MSTEHRIFHRNTVYSNLVLIDIPEISDVLLSPRDISIGGFMIESTRPTEVGESVDCTIEIMGKTFIGCRADTAWITENKTDPPTWNIGFSVHVPENELSNFEDVMKKYFPAEEQQEEF